VNDIDTPRYSTIEVCRLAGLTYRQADYLADWVGHVANGPGRPRRWTPRQVVQAYVISTLMGRGVEKPAASTVAQLVRADVEYIVVPAEAGEAFAATDLLDLLDGIAGPATVVVKLPPELRDLITSPQKETFRRRDGDHPSLRE
jgi:hypothetical protein